MSNLETTQEDTPASAQSKSRPMAPFLFSVLHCDEVGLGGARWCLETVDRVLFTRGSERSATQVDTDDGPALAVTVPGTFVSRNHAKLVRTHRSWVLTDTGSRNGVRVNGAATQNAVLKDGDIFEIGHSFFVFHGQVDHAGNNRDLTLEPSHGDSMFTLWPTLEALFQRLLRIAPTKVSVLLLGETGVGKDRAARAVHASSSRGGPFVAVNCGAIARDLTESAFFGHVRGAFSGATRDELGFFRTAHDGTIFLDEVGDLPPAAQAALLRTLEDGSVNPVGSARQIPVDVRVVSATHHPLRALAETGGFRQDLLARLTGFEVELPPLRERSVDIGLLVGSLGTNALQRLTPAAGLALLQHSWPHNIRELKAALESALALSTDGVIDRQHLPPTLGSAQQPSALSESNEALEARLQGLLQTHQGNVAAVARAMGKAPIQIHRWVKKLSLDLSAYRAPNKRNDG